MPLILNADDFGLTPGINRAIAELHQAGVLTSATLMATGPAFADAAAIARTLPTLGTGCHIVLVDGTPLSPPHQIPTLLGPDRTSFRPTLGAFVRDLLLGRIAEADIAREALAQVQHLQQAGIAPTHLDTHKHTHIFPAVTRALVHVAQQTAIPALRNPFEPAFTRRLGHAPLTRRLQLTALNRFQPTFNRLTRNLKTTAGTIGIAATGSLTPYTLYQLLRALPAEGAYEFCCHPGYTGPDLDRIPTRLRTHRNTEREALLQEVPRTPATLIHYGDL